MPELKRCLLLVAAGTASPRLVRLFSFCEDPALPTSKVEKWRMLMPVLPETTDPLDRLMAWGNAHPTIRAMILTSTGARPHGPVDHLSDDDVIVVVTDADGFGSGYPLRVSYLTRLPANIDQD